VPVNEAGASIYSASDVAREEFPDLDLTVRGAISIARRLQDPLAELVKVDPKSIGVGQYQHDVSQPALGRKLDEVVESCVNSVGVELNTASAPLLSRVAGLGPSIAKRIVHGSNYMMTPRRMWELYPEQFKTRKEAASLQALYFEVCPAVQRWQQQTIEVTDNGAMLRNPYGYLHYFFNVKEWSKHNGSWIWKPGEDAKRAIAFMPQSTAAAIIKEAMLRLKANGLADSHLELGGEPARDGLRRHSPRLRVADHAFDARPASRHSFGRRVVLPLPVSPQTTMTRCAAIASSSSSLAAVIGSDSGYSSR
jgi:DNA uptake protein ComE-like DNA-binding protein